MKHLINVTALGLEEEAIEASYWHKGLCKLINGDIYVDPEDFHLLLEESPSATLGLNPLEAKGFFAGQEDIYAEYT